MRALFSVSSAPSLLLAFTVATSLAACGDDGITPVSTSTTTTTAGSTTGSGGAGTTSSSIATSSASSSTSSSTTSSSSSGTGGAPSLGINKGSVSVFSGASSMTAIHGYEANASFISNSDGNAGVFTSTTFGACTLKAFSTPTALGTKNYQSAGIVSISGGTTTLMLAPGTDKKYPTEQNVMTDLFAGGETITISAPGADVPAFNVVAIAPSAVNLLTPVEPSGNSPLLIDRTQDLHLTWTGGGVGHVLLVMNGSPNLQLTCSFSSGDGAGSVPHAALSSFQAQSTGLFVMSPTETTTVTAGEYDVDILVGNSLTWNGVVNPQTFSFQATN